MIDTFVPPVQPVIEPAVAGLFVTMIDETGEVVLTMTVPDQAHIDMNIPVGGSYVEGHAPEKSYRLNDAWVTKPPRPNGFFTWDKTTKTWIDTRPLDQQKIDKWTDMKIAREAALVAPFTTPFGIFDGTTDAQKSITDAVLMLQTLASLGTPTNIDFTLADNTTVNLTTAQMVQVGLLLGQRTQTVYANGRAKRIAIDSATTIADVEAITWS